MSTQVLCPFIIWINCMFVLLLSCMHSLHILSIKPLSDVWFTKFFSHSVSYLFTLLIILLCRSFFEESQLFIFNFLVYALSVNPPKSLPRHMSRSFHPMFSSRIFMVSRLTFKSLIHFKLIFVKKEVPFHFFLHVDI